MNRKAFLIFLFTLGLITWSSTARSATFTVTTGSDTDCSDFDCKLQNALDVAAANNADDTIEVSSGTYTPASTFTYISSEDKTLTITSHAPVETVQLSGNTSNQVLHIETDLSNTNAHITVKNLTIIYGYHLTESGGLYIRTGSSDVYIDNCTFQSNSTNSPNGGGGAYIRGSGNIEILNSLFTGNSINFDNSRGGGLYLHGSVSSLVTVAGNSFLNNHAASGGSGSGAYIRSVGSESLWITHNIFKGNSIPETGTGGALRLEIYSSYVNCSVVNNVFIDNSAAKAEIADWAASAVLIYNDLAGATFTSNTVTRNEGDGASAVRIEATRSDIYNNIIWGNTTALDLKVTDSPLPVNLYHNDLSSKEVPAGTVEVNNIDANPFANVITIDLKPGSLAIDSGIDAAPVVPAKDIDGDDRILDGDSDGTARIDMGADEYKPAPSGCLADGYCNSFCPIGHDLDCNPGVWYEATTIESPLEDDSISHFGYSLDLENNTLAVGASAQDLGSNVDAGAVFVFERNSSDEWIHQATVDAGSYRQTDGSFGTTVALEGDWLFVGAPEEDLMGAPGIDHGAVYIFHRNEGGPDSWDLVERKTSGAPIAEGNFGHAISIYDNLLAIGCPGADPGLMGIDRSGSVYIYELTEGIWEDHSTIRPPDDYPNVPESLNGARFGMTVSIVDDILAIGAPFADYGESNDDYGTIFTYRISVPIIHTEPRYWIQFDGSKECGDLLATNGNTLIVRRKNQIGFYAYSRSMIDTWIFEQSIIDAPINFFSFNDNYLAVSRFEPQYKLGDISLHYLNNLFPMVSVQLLYPNDGLLRGFGKSHSMDGAVLAVSRPETTYSSGTIYIFQLPGSELPDPGPIPEGYTEAETFLDTINSGETNSHQFNVPDVTGMSVILSFASEFNIKVYRPDGSLFTERQSSISPITISIDNARTGDWKFDVSAISTSRPDTPYSLVIAFGDPSEEFPWEIFYPAFIKK